ncbi:MAG TPA: hypothetical protein DF712_01490, partial [Balneola sp.]|nr:hypothetical protein [Balneola sp.]
FRALFGRWTQSQSGISFSLLENDSTVQLDKIFDPVPLEPDLATGNVSLADGTESFTDAITSTSDENTSLFRPTEEIERPLGS